MPGRRNIANTTRMRAVAGKAIAVAHLRGLVFALVLMLNAGAVCAQEPRQVSMELVLAVDSSASVDDAEYALQIRGIAEALRRPEIISIIRQYGDGVAVSVIHWGGWADSVLDPPWRLLTTRGNILALADELDAVERRGVGPLTALGHAIDVAVELIETNAFHGRQRKIDISGDGRNNSGRAPGVARLEAVARGISINGLVILSDDAGLFEYYSNNVAAGPARFVMQIDSYDDYAIAIARKLKRELAPPIAMKTDPVGVRKVQMITEQNGLK